MNIIWSLYTYSMHKSEKKTTENERVSIQVHTSIYRELMGTVSYTPYAPNLPLLYKAFNLIHLWITKNA